MYKAFVLCDLKERYHYDMKFMLVSARSFNWALEYHTLILFLKGTII